MLATDLRPGDLVRLEGMSLIIERGRGTSDLVTLTFADFDWELTLKHDTPVRRLG